MADELAKLEQALFLSYDSGSREKAIPMLGQLRVSSYGEVSSRAWARLREIDAEQPTKRTDAEIERLTELWTSIRDPNLADKPLDEGGLEAFCAAAEQRLCALKGLASRVRSVLGAWVAAFAARVGVAQLRGLEAHVGRFEQLAAIVRQYPHLAVELREALEEIDEVTSTQRLRLASVTIGALMRQGQLGEAWRRFNQLRRPASSGSSDWQDLKTRLDHATALTTELETWVNKAASLVPTWNDLAAAVVVWQDGRQLLRAVDDVPPPGPLVLLMQARAHWISLSTRLEQVIADRSASVDSIDSFDRFIRDCYRSWPNRKDLPRHWLEPADRQVEAAIRHEIDSAATPEGLRQIVTRLFSDVHNIPDEYVQPLMETRHTLARVSDAWTDLVHGEARAVEALDSVSESLVPQAARSQLVRSRGPFTLVSQAREGLSTGVTAADRVYACERAIRVANEILHDFPRHAEAKRLRVDAERGQRHVELDLRLEAWDIDGFARVFDATSDWDPSYQALFAHLNTLMRLAALRGRTFEHLIEPALDWWAEWSEAVAALPSGRPPTFDRVLSIERSTFGEQLNAALDARLAGCSDPAEDRQLALRARTVALEFGIGERCRQLEIRASITFDAQAARDKGIRVFSEHLDQHWGTISRYDRGQGLDWLREAIRTAWDEQRDPELNMLAAVANRDVTEHPRDSPMRGWLEWVSLEAGLHASVTPQLVDRLMDHVRRHKAAEDRCVLLPDAGGRSWEVPLAARLRRLVDVWRERGDVVALGWAHRAFAAVEPMPMPGADPVAGLHGETTRVADAVLWALRATNHVSPSDLAAHREAIRAESDRWTRLEGLLRTSFAGSGWPEPPPGLRVALGAVENLASLQRGVDELLNQDLREARLEWESTYRLAKFTLKDYPFAADHVPLLEAIEPLTRLKYLEDQLRGAAAACGSPAPAEILQRGGLFEAARQAVLSIIGVFEQASSLVPPPWTFTSSPMRRIVSAAYWNEFSELAGDQLGPPADPSDLQALAERFKELELDEEFFAAAVDRLREQQPPVAGSAGFKALQHASYLACYPRRPPLSKRVRWQFELLLLTDAQRVIVHNAGEQRLPPWMHRYATRPLEGPRS